MKDDKPLIRGAVVYFVDNTRPYLVVSNNAGNKHAADISVVPLIAKAKRTDLKTHTQINYHKSYVLCEHVQTVPKDKIRCIPHVVNGSIMRRVDECLRVALGLNKD